MDAVHAGLVCYVEPGSPADDVGFEPGCRIVSADGHPLHDIIDWRWYASDDSVEVGYIDTDGDTGVVLLERDEGQEWGIEFDDIIFDEPKVCRNACTFCFMRQLPEDSRESLRLRDDDYRLSFLQGNFVTFTNLTDDDVARIIEQHISPLRFSLHAVDSDLRTTIIGRHAARGLEVAQQLLDAGIELHAQIVLMPNVNDGEHLAETLTWAFAQPGIINVAIVPLGYTSHQEQFTESFQDMQRAREVLATVKPFQDQALSERGHGWAYPSDEIYRYAYPDTLLDMLPEASFYGDFGMFEDGIGIIRSFVDDWQAAKDAQRLLAESLQSHGQKAVFICGCAQREFLDPLVAASPLCDVFVPLYVKNEYFGGNVDVTGLLCGCDIAPAVAKLPHDLRSGIVCVPSVVLNADKVTLDDMTIEQISAQAGVPVHVVSCEASKFLPEIQEIAYEQGVGHV